MPVGEDQSQHLELAVKIAEKFNRTYNSVPRKLVFRLAHCWFGEQHDMQDLFAIPQPLLDVTGGVRRVMSFRDGLKKMSKSDLIARRSAYSFLGIITQVAVILPLMFFFYCGFLLLLFFFFFWYSRIDLTDTADDIRLKIEVIKPLIPLPSPIATRSLHVGGHRV